MALNFDMCLALANGIVREYDTWEGLKCTGIAEPVFLHFYLLPEGEYPEKFWSKKIKSTCSRSAPKLQLETRPSLTCINPIPDNLLHA